MSKITVIWDAVLDNYIYWNTDKKNPESPMPLLIVEEEEYRLWWASNVANNIASLNWWVNLISIIWKDENWKKFKKLCEKNKINLIWIISDNPTITKIRFIDSQYKQQLLRVDYEKKNNLVNYNAQEIIDILSLQKPKYIVISDYNKWIINKNLVEEVKNFSKKNWSSILVDTKPQNINLFNWVFLIKPNFKEFCEMIWQKIDNTDENIENYWKEFTKKYNTNLVVTRSAKWSSLITIDWNVFHIKPSEVRKVFDVTWAWDTFIATIAYWLDNWYNLEDAVRLANKASWIVVEKVGTATVTKEELWI
jgi:rfaE bifunctional protein kinase chain/domain